MHVQNIRTEKCLLRKPLDRCDAGTVKKVKKVLILDEKTFLLTTDVKSGSFLFRRKRCEIIAWYMVLWMEPSSRPNILGLNGST